MMKEESITDGLVDYTVQNVGKNLTLVESVSSGVGFLMDGFGREAQETGRCIRY